MEVMTHVSSDRYHVILLPYELDHWLFDLIICLQNARDMEIECAYFLLSRALTEWQTEAEMLQSVT